MRKIALLICLLLLSPLVMAEDIATTQTLNIQSNIVTTGDTAMVIKITPKLPISGFIFGDSFSYYNAAGDTTDGPLTGIDTSAHQTINWTSPMQSMILTIAGNTGDLTKLDTVGIGVVKCTVQFASQVLGFDYDLSTGADSTLATALDSIVAIFNGTTNLTDSVDAQDSGSYIKLVSLVAENTLTQRWTLGFPSDSCDTATGDDNVTIAMICDSMVASINADAGLDSFLTAYDSTTFYITQSDDPGLLFLDTVLNHADTHGTVATTQANVTSYSTNADTTFFAPGFFREDHITGIYGSMIFAASATTTQGIGLKDTVHLVLATAREWWDGTKEYFVMDSAVGPIPCTLRFARLPGATGYDTLFKSSFYVITQSTDSASDTMASITYPLYMDYILLDDN